MKWELPENWIWTSFGQVAEYINGRVFSKEEWEDQGRPIIRIQNLTGTGDTLNRFSGKVDEKHIIRDGDLLISWSATIDAHIYRGEEAALNQHIFKVNANEKINKLFLYYYTKLYAGELMKKAQGTGMKHITKSKFKESELLLPPISEQERIVMKIEELLSKLDSGVSELEGAKQGLEWYRRSLLNKAVNGGLTQKWRNERNLRKKCGVENLEEIKGEHEVEGELANLPENWKWAKLGDITDNFDSEREPINSSKRAEMQGEYPYYGASGVIDHLNDYILDGRFLLISEDGANLENRTKPIAFIVDGKFWPNNHAHVVQTKYGIPLDYLELYIESRPVRAYLSGTAQPKLTQTNLNKIPVPIGPKEELEKIVELTQRNLSVLESVSNNLDDDLTRAESLRQAILKHAFEGNLVPQDLTNKLSTNRPESKDSKSEWGSQKTLSEVTSDAE